MHLFPLSTTAVLTNAYQCLPPDHELAGRVCTRIDRALTRPIRHLELDWVLGR